MQEQLISAHGQNYAINFIQNSAETLLSNFQLQQYFKFSLSILNRCIILHVILSLWKLMNSCHSTGMDLKLQCSDTVLTSVHWATSLFSKFIFVQRAHFTLLQCYDQHLQLNTNLDVYSLSHLSTPPDRQAVLILSNALI